MSKLALPFGDVVSKATSPPPGTPLPGTAAQRKLDQGAAPAPPDFKFVNPYSVDQLGVAFYRQWNMDVEYFTDEGIGGVPTDGDTEIVKLHNSATIKVVEWTAEREGAWPVLPHWAPINSNEVLKSRKIIPANPLLVGDTYTYRVSGVYTYILKKALGETDDMPTGHSPADTATPDITTLPVRQFDKTLMAPGTTEPGPAPAPPTPKWQDPLAQP